MVRLWLVEWIKIQVSFAKEPYKRDNILQKRPKKCIFALIHELWSSCIKAKFMYQSKNAFFALIHELPFALIHELCFDTWSLLWYMKQKMHFLLWYMNFMWYICTEFSKSQLYSLFERKPPPQGVSYLLCSLIKNPEEEVPPLRISTRCFEGVPLPPGSWSGNIINRKTPWGGGVLSIKSLHIVHSGVC